MHPKSRKSAARTAGLCAWALSVALTAGCKKTPEPEPMHETSPAPSAAAPMPEQRPAAGPVTTELSWEDPPGWVKGPGSPMRLATYRVPGEAGADAEMSVSHFPGGAGGAVEANFSRWIGQFEGKHSDPVRTEIEKRPYPAHVLEIAEGTYRGMQGEPKSDQSLVGAIVDTPSGPYFFKLTGPVKTVQAQKKTFLNVIGTLAPPPG